MTPKINIMPDVNCLLGWTSLHCTGATNRKDTMNRQSVSILLSCVMEIVPRAGLERSRYIAFQWRYPVSTLIWTGESVSEWGNRFSQHRQLEASTCFTFYSPSNISFSLGNPETFLKPRFGLLYLRLLMPSSKFKSFSLHFRNNDWDLSMADSFHPPFFFNYFSKLIDRPLNFWINGGLVPSTLLRA